MEEEKSNPVTFSPEEQLLPFVHADPHAFMALGMYAESLAYEEREKADYLRSKMNEILEQVLNGEDKGLIARFTLIFARFQ